ncbi:MAG: hypothetical protein ACI4LA_08810 [Emergencia sp.]
MKTKKVTAVIIVILLAAAVTAGYFLSQNWTIRFRAELDSFFGEGNWECISEETKDSMIYSEYVSVHSSPELSYDRPVTAENYLACSLQDFYLDIRAFDYRMDNLTEEQRQHVLDSMKTMEARLRSRFGRYADFRIWLDEDHQVEYEKGVRQTGGE